MEKLFELDPYLTHFTACVQSCVQSRKGWDVILDQTAFYPEGGGQPYDLGTLGGTSVLEVHEREGHVVHTCDRPLEPGSQVEGDIDWPRRFDLMQHHSGEHIVSGIAHARYGCENVGFHMGAEEVTVDFNGIIEPEDLDWLEDEANQLVYANVPVKVLYPSEDELKTMEYRSKKELSGLVRIVEVPGADVCACCGTHVENTGEVGIIKIRSMIHYKGGVRLSMLCGRRALLDYRDRLKDEARISNLLSAKLVQVPDAVEKLKSDSQDKDYLIGKLGSSLLALKAGQFPESTEPLIVFEEDLTPIQVRQYATLLYEQNKAGVAAVCSGNDRDSEYHYALGSSRMDMRALSKAMNSRLSGRGGGSSLMAQGTFRAAREAIEAAFLEETEL